MLHSCGGVRLSGMDEVKVSRVDSKRTTTSNIYIYIYNKKLKKKGKLYRGRWHLSTKIIQAQQAESKRRITQSSGDIADDLLASRRMQLGHRYGTSHAR